MSTAQKGLAILGVASAMIFAGSAFAQKGSEAGWYVGASFGQSQVDVDCSGTTACDDKDSAWKIFGGYQINRYFSVELGYADLGEFTASTPSFVVPPSLVVPPANIKIESTVWDLVAIGSLPLGERFSVFGKLGVYTGDTETTVDFGALGSVSESEDTTDLTFGVGVRFDFTRNFGLRAEWQRYAGLKAMEGEESDVDVISLGALWKF